MLWQGINYIHYIAKFTLCIFKSQFLLQYFKWILHILSVYYGGKKKYVLTYNTLLYWSLYKFKFREHGNRPFGSPSPHTESSDHSFTLLIPLHSTGNLQRPTNPHVFRIWRKRTWSKGECANSMQKTSMVSIEPGSLALRGSSPTTVPPCFGWANIFSLCNLKNQLQLLNLSVRMQSNILGDQFWSNKI